MTTDIIQLSKQVAAVLGVKASVPVYTGDHPEIGPLYDNLWLAEDAGRCAEIAVERLLGTDHNDKRVVFIWWFDTDDKLHRVYESLSIHNGYRKQAWCVAVCKAVIEQAKGE